MGIYGRIGKGVNGGVGGIGDRWTANLDGSGGILLKADPVRSVPVQIVSLEVVLAAVDFPERVMFSGFRTCEVIGEKLTAPVDVRGAAAY